MMVIIRNTLDAKTAESTFKSLNKQLASDFGAKVTFEDFWGERGFAYKIKQDTWGYYGVSQFDMEAAKVTEARHELNLDKNVLRFSITKVDPRAGEPKKYAEMQAEYEAQAKKKGAEKAAKKAAPGKRSKLTTVKEAPVAAKAAPTEKKVEETAKDAVDKKLDAIIDASSTDL